MNMDCREMVRDRATTGIGVLCRCRMSMGEMRGKIFVKLMEAMVESALVYGAEVWEAVSGLIA